MKYYQQWWVSNHLCFRSW